MLFHEVVCHHSDWRGVTFARILYSCCQLGGKRVEDA